MTERRIRITAQPRDPVAVNRLVRLLIAQVQAEQRRRPVTEVVAPGKAAEDKEGRDG